MHTIRVAERLGASSRRPRHPQALDDEELFIIEGSPGAQLRDNPEECEKWPEQAKKPSIIARHNRHIGGNRSVVVCCGVVACCGLLWLVVVGCVWSWWLCVVVVVVVRMIKETRVSVHARTYRGGRSPGSQTPATRHPGALNVQMDGGRKMLQNCSELPFIAARSRPCTAATVLTCLCGD